MLHSGLTYAIRTATILAWLAAAIALFPFGRFITDDMARFALLVGMVGVCHYLTTFVARPAHELYLAGKAAGRAELLREQAAPQRVIRLEDRRRLRESLEDERAVGGGTRLV